MKNSTYSAIIKVCPRLIEQRTVAPKKGKGAKRRPRNSNRAP